MHELSIISSVINMVYENCRYNNISKVEKIVLKMGEFSYINNSSLIFAFESLSKDGICEGATLDIEKVIAMAYCKNCNKEFHLEFSKKECPICNSYSMDITNGYEMLLYRIEGE
ncbi:hydrogenase maturation nickel metallochaperone HypA [Clostridium gasigenes]|uniref:hydrogenase maturation nickel metallochaperone HypA n=1 Tax=Clostridium gasigenes TaxID=94869 RepID=UPI001C0D9175|nr:hydrogenase maturation nickel metallochaperone HypA [Clostridium gasigenes]